MRPDLEILRMAYILVPSCSCSEEDVKLNKHTCFCWTAQSVTNTTNACVLHIQHLFYACMCFFNRAVLRPKNAVLRTEMLLVHCPERNLSWYTVPSATSQYFSRPNSIRVWSCSALNTYTLLSQKKKCVIWFGPALQRTTT